MNRFSRWVAFKTLPKLVKVELNSVRVKDLSDSDAKSKAIYTSRKDSFKGYGITLEDVKKIVEKESQIKKGLMAKMALKNATKSVQEAIRVGRIEFIDSNSIIYFDKEDKEFHYTFDEMADRIFDNVGKNKVSIPGMGNVSYASSLYLMGITSLDMRKIIDDEYKKIVNK